MNCVVQIESWLFVQIHWSNAEEQTEVYSAE